MSDTHNLDLFGGLDFETTREIEVPDKLIDQVIGQERAREIINTAAEQKRHVLMIGKPGTGKSMLAKAMSELLPKEDRKDVLVYPNEDDENSPKVKTVDSGRGKEIVEAHREEADKKQRMVRILGGLLAAFALIYGILSSRFLMGVIAATLIFAVGVVWIPNKISGNIVPNLLIDNSESERIFEDATGVHSGALVGDVRHDPYQSAGLGEPAHQRVEAGAIHKAHKGVLYIDEINTISVRDQQKLMTAIQDGEFSITGQSENSSGSMVETEKVPCDFVMVAAGNKDAIENMHPALRSRLRGYGYEVRFEHMADDTENIRRKLVQFVAQEVERTGNIPHFSQEAVGKIIQEAKRRAGRKGKVTLELRELGGIVRVAGDIARKEDSEVVKPDHVKKAQEQSKSIEEQLGDAFVEQKEQYDVSVVEGSKVGQVNGLAVMGGRAGILKPISARIIEGGDGEVIPTGNLQDIAQESVDNVVSVVKSVVADVTKEDPSNMDFHVQFLQSHEGVEGDSASVTMATAWISCIKNIGVRQDVAMTGSLSVRGDVQPVGGVTHKIEAAIQRGMNKVIIPFHNKEDVMIDEDEKEEIDIVYAKNIKDVLKVALDDCEEKQNILSSM